MRLLRRLLAWLGRRAVLYVLLVLALAAGHFISEEWGEIQERREALATLRAEQARMRSERDSWKQETLEAAAGLGIEGADELDDRIADTKKRKKEAQARVKTGIEGLRPKAIVENQRLKLTIARFDYELTALYAAENLVAGRDADPRRRVELQDAERRCTRAKAAREALDDKWSYRWRSLIESKEHKKLAEAEQEACDERDRLKAGLQQVASAEKALDSTYDRVLAEVGVAEKKANDRYDGTIPRKLQLWAEEEKVDDLLWRAFVALLVIMAMPYLIRLLFWLVLAPLAQRRRAIRLDVPGDETATIPPVEPSKTAVAIRLAANEELLVRQGFRQTTSADGRKATKWLLNWRRPLSSIASGMTFLTQVRGTDETTTVSAVKDPFAEVTVMTLPEGATCVLQPRALAAVVQPIGRPMRLTSHWRLRSLNAWLTMQLRYLVFHGPCRLVIKGSRGVRVERAERGRIFGQAQLIGFSADLDYSVTRTETFWPYFLGHEQLFRDRVEAGTGVLLVEEAPLAGRKGAGARRGLEDVFEVMTKALGI